MNGKKKGICILGVLIFLCSVASATDLTFSEMFPECTGDTNFNSSLRCATYVLVPNFHFPELWNLVIGGFFDSIYSAGDHVITSFGSMFLPDSGIYEDSQNQNWTGIIDRALNLALSPFVAVEILLYRIFSSILAYMILMTYEVVKTYVLWATGWLLWSEVLFGEQRYGDFLKDPMIMSLLISGTLLVGSIIVLSMDWTIWGGG